MKVLNPTIIFDGSLWCSGSAIGSCSTGANVVVHILKSGDELYLVIGHLALVDFGSTGCTVLCTCSQRFKLFGFPIF